MIYLDINKKSIKFVKKREYERRAFDYHQYRIRDIADTIERDIALALQPKPDMVHEDFWAINEMDSLQSYHPYCIQLKFDTYEKLKIIS